MKISIKLVYQYMAIFFNFSPTSNHLHPLQVENCESNSRLVDDDDNVKSGLKGLSSISADQRITMGTTQQTKGLPPAPHVKLQTVICCMIMKLFDIILKPPLLPDSDKSLCLSIVDATTKMQSDNDVMLKTW